MTQTLVRRLIYGTRLPASGCSHFQARKLNRVLNIVREFAHRAQSDSTYRIVGRDQGDLLTNGAAWASPQEAAPQPAAANRSAGALVSRSRASMASPGI